MSLDSPEQLQIRDRVSLAPLTSMKVGGAAEYFISPRSASELAASLTWASDRHLPTTIIGAGSNLLISDEGLEGLVICTRHLRGIDFNEQTGQVKAAAGEPVARLAMQIATHGWSGFEWAVGIPGTVGGLVVMNAGAQGGCAADCVVEVQTVNFMGQTQLIYPQDLNFSYRTSALQNSQLLVTGATLNLQTGGNPEAIATDTEAKLKARHSTQPYHLPNCGSVFRNPLPQFAAKLIQDAGLKGYQIGKAQVSELHANFIVNLGNAKAKDIFSLIEHIKTVISDRYGVLLETEVKLIGYF
ncbi:UDP-N-acetylmuramate dehydrogenase [Pseudanabaena sp. FACHB-1998]|uniref:UDP-N-acetylmuramate dehydrogenase n=1 Tax=Pseudanabaena sp. FACHB-1998 TaxID=2692858 RepID=UPI001680893A|nr:UDP-N-acetylmuramate dehydrogenase [Pseudanabaena sp. FACHB-1998]MBD2178785.1 UDP-N-acetylmuramate dehydrogenase [Pseudanabaena sp. FACHB-1998]